MLCTKIVNLLCIFSSEWENKVSFFKKTTVSLQGLQLALYFSCFFCQTKILGTCSVEFLTRKSKDSSIWTEGKNMIMQMTIKANFLENFALCTNSRVSLILKLYVEVQFEYLLKIFWTYLDVNPSILEIFSKDLI